MLANLGFDDKHDRLDGIVSQDQLVQTARWIADLQLANGMIPWFPNGHCDPWNHVETAMALDIMGFHDNAQRAYRWLVDQQRRDGSWFNYYLPDGSIEDDKLDTNVCAYIGAGIWHHWLISNDLTFTHQMWPTVKRAINWVMNMRRADGTILWARQVDNQPWDYALLTGSSSIRHALRCAVNLGTLIGDPQPQWREAADAIDHIICTDQDAFEPKLRWAMDWYYPVLTGALTGPEAKDRLADRWDEFVIVGRGVRCVSDEQWVTAAETAECAVAHVAVGDIDTARELLSWTTPHRKDNGSYYTGIVYPKHIIFPAEEASAYTGAAIIIAADAIAGATATSQLFPSADVND
ncbi:MAG: prenyltransferase [Ilumatobacteraceae bacterium]